MLKNKIIIIPFNLPWEWSTDYTNQTAFILAKKNIVIAFMWAEGFSLKEYLIKKKFPRLIKRHSKNLYIFYPIEFLPFKRFRFIANLNQRIIIYLLNIFVNILEKRNQIKGNIFWIFDPNTRFICDFFDNNWKVIYDCVDFFGASGNKRERDETWLNEKKLAKRAFLVTAISTVLQKHLMKYRPDVNLVPQGFRIQDFRRTKYHAPKIKLSRPIIGFAGAVNYRIDYDLLLPLAKKNPQWSFVIWGPVLEKERIDNKTLLKMKELLNLTNVTSGFIKDRRELPGVFKQFDIAMIPYDISQDFNKYCYPMKLFEFFYLGKPVVSTAVEELKRFPKYVKIGKNYKEWEKIIKSLLSRSWPKNYQAEERKLAKENSWAAKVEKISEFFEAKKDNQENF